MGEQAPAPQRDRQDDRDRGEAEQLHQEVGGDRAPGAQEIVHRRAGGVAQARILHRPGRERDRAYAGADHERKPADLAQAVAQREAEILRQEAGIESAIEGGHRHSGLLYARPVSVAGMRYPSTATMR